MSRTKAKAPKGKNSLKRTDHETLMFMLRRIKQRKELMRDTDREVKDLTNLEEIDFSALSIQTEDSRKFEAHLSVGLLGYDNSFPVGEVIIDQNWLRSKDMLHQCVLDCARGTLQKFGISNDSRLYGLEVQYVLGYSSTQGSVQAGAFALINTVEDLKAWITQLSKGVMFARSITARFVRTNGQRFEPTFRTKREIAAEQKQLRSVNEKKLASTSNDSKPFKTRKVAQRLDRLLKERENAMNQPVLSRSTPDFDPPSPTRRQFRTFSLPEADLRQLGLATDVAMQDITAQTGDIEMGEVSQ